jgi:hypothetical protein
MNQLTPEQLDMIKRLQPLFKEKMGEWQIGDIIILPDGDLDCIYKADVVTWRMMPQLSDAFDDCLRIPKPIDWQNESRGLWGMLKGFKQLKQGTVYESTVNDSLVVDRKEYIAPDPVTALLKALCEQEGV